MAALLVVLLDEDFNLGIEVARSGMVLHRSMPRGLGPTFHDVMRALTMAMPGGRSAISSGSSVALPVASARRAGRAVRTRPPWSGCPRLRFCSAPGQGHDDAVGIRWITRAPPADMPIGPHQQQPRPAW